MAYSSPLPPKGEGGGKDGLGGMPPPGSPPVKGRERWRLPPAGPHPDPLMGKGRSGSPHVRHGGLTYAGWTGRVDSCIGRRLKKAPAPAGRPESWQPLRLVILPEDGRGGEQGKDARHSTTSFSGPPVDTGGHSARE